MKNQDKRFTCLFCDKLHAGAYLLEDHLRSHLQEKPFECNLCEITFFSKRILHMHHIQFHETNKPYSCSSCEINFPSKALLNRHTKLTHQEKLFKCAICGRGFHYKKDLKLHQLIHTRTRMSKYERHTCLFCYKIYSVKIDHFTHLLKHIGERPFECDVCDYSCTSLFYLKTHQDTHTSPNYKCNECSKVYKTYQSLWDHKNQVHVRKYRYSCSICEYATYNKYSYYNHIRSHTGERLHTCEICKKTFTSSGALILHRAVHFPELRKQQSRNCPSCGKTFRSASSLKVHLQTVHSDLRPYQCQFCNKRSKTRTDLISHVVIHTGEKFHRCRVCSKTFTSSAHRLSHEQWAHKIGNPEICCDVCNRLIRKANYGEHRRRHHNIKSWECLFCEKRFCSKGDLFRHIRTHTKERRF